MVFAVFWGVAWGVAGLLGTVGWAAEAPPAILLLGIDTLRGDHLHCAGMDSLQTPHIDALAADGVYFRRCFTTAPWTLPSFASLYTGLLPYHHGAIGGTWRRLDDNLTTLAEHLASAGYATGAYVTINYLTHKFNMMQGFAESEHLGSDQDSSPASQVTLRGRSFIDRKAGRPFFLLLHYFDVHAPYLPPPPYDHMYYNGDERGPGDEILPFLLSSANKARNKDSGLYSWLAGITDLVYPVRQYMAEVSFVDDHVGQLLDHLKAVGQYDDMLIVLMSDHGEHLGEHDIYFTHTLPYHETMHVPLIIKLPGNRYAGRLVDEPVSLLDVLPTLLELAGLTVPSGLDGRSLLTVLAGQSSLDASLLVAEVGSTKGRFAKAIVEWPWKLLLLQFGNRSLYSLFNLASDPGETIDLARQKPDITARLRARLWEIFDPDRPLLVREEARPAELDEVTRQKLRSLGY